LCFASPFAGFPRQFDVAHAIGAELANQGIVVLLGLGILRQCTLFYNLASGAITLSV